MRGNGGPGHPASLFTIIIWGTALISAGILPANFQPVMISYEKITAPAAVFQRTKDF